MNRYFNQAQIQSWADFQPQPDDRVALTEINVTAWLKGALMFIPWVVGIGFIAWLASEVVQGIGG